MDISTTYMGLKLKSPLIAGSSGLTESMDTIVKLEQHGAGAIVLKSLFEEEVRHISRQMHETDPGEKHHGSVDHLRSASGEKLIGDYLRLIGKAKKSCSIPVMASIHCCNDSEWVYLAKKAEEAGADGLEMNMIFLPTDFINEGTYHEDHYFKAFREVRKHVQIPIAIKLSAYFSGLARFVLKLSWDGPGALVLFNRYLSPDFDIDNFEVIPYSELSKPGDMYVSLRWVALLSNRIYCDIAASTGVHDGRAMVKQLLAGAKAVQVVSALYKYGPAHAAVMIGQLEEWMKQHNFSSIEEFRGKMSLKETDGTSLLERVQFMKYFGGDK